MRLPIGNGVLRRDKLIKPQGKGLVPPSIPGVESEGEKNQLNLDLITSNMEEMHTNHRLYQLNGNVLITFLDTKRKALLLSIR